ncbi:MAG: hypothetical protein ACYDA8_22730, partial [Deferrisomatales bacterium]
ANGRKKSFVIARCYDTSGVTRVHRTGLKYLLTLHVTADFDGQLPAGGGMDDLEAFMRRIDSPAPKEAENDVYQTHGYLLCPACKAAFLADPLGLKARGNDPEAGGRVH